MQRPATIFALIVLFLVGTNCNAQTNPFLRQANQLNSQKDWNGLAQLSAQWVKKEPNSYDAWCDLAVAHARLKQYKDAITEFNRASEINPSAPGVWHTLAICYSHLDNLDGAYKAVAQGEQHGVAARTMNWHYWYIYGNDYGALQKFDRAKQAFKNAIAGNPRFGEAWSNLGLMYELTNDNKNALACYQKGGALGDQAGQYNARTLQSRINAKNAPRVVSRGGSASNLISRRMTIDFVESHSPH
ncbi:MAG TPA: tetratricopeptide repeat protein [Planktothrix sp.]